MKGVNPENGPGYQDDDREVDLHADMTLVVHVDTTSMAWAASPAQGVERKRLELIGDAEPQLTTLVRFQPGSCFSEHTHDGGEEFLVLDGVFSDETGDYGPGSYIRNPPGTRHAPFTDQGCTILVKLRQFQSGDQRQCVTDSQGYETNAWSTLTQGIAYLLLHEYGDEKISLLRMETDTSLPKALYPHGLEFYVIEGELLVGEVIAVQGYWLRLPPDVGLEIKSRKKCLCYLKQGPIGRYRDK